MKTVQNKYQAYQQFIADLKNDKDFIEFKNKATKVKEGYSYGVVVVRTNRFTIEKCNKLTTIN